MRFTRVEQIPERDKHLIEMWTSESGLAHICVERIFGAVRVQVWYEVPHAQFPNILRTTWDTLPDENLMQVIMDIQEALTELPELADRRAVDQRTQILMFEKYGDIYDGLKCRLIDRQHPDYNPHANPWWNNAVELREQLSSGVYRHHLPLNLDAPLVGDVWKEPASPVIQKEWEPIPEQWCPDCQLGVSPGSGASPSTDTCPGCGHPLEDKPFDDDDDDDDRRPWLEQAWVNDRSNIPHTRPNPGWCVPVPGPKDPTTA